MTRACRAVSAFCLRSVFPQSGEIFTEIRLEIDYLPFLGIFSLIKRLKRDIPTKSTCFMGRGGGLVVPGTTNPPPSPTSTEQTLTKAELASQTKKKDINMNIEINEKHNNLYNK